MNRHAVLIERLGGAAYLASVLGINVAAVQKWPVRGIPARHWHRIVAISPGTTPEWLARTKPVGVQSRKLNGR